MPIQSNRKNSVRFNLQICLKQTNTKDSARLTAIVLWLKAAPKFLTSVIFISYCCFKVFAPFHPLKGFTTYLHVAILSCMLVSRDEHTDSLNTFAASYLNTQGLNNSCLKSPASTLVDLTFQSRALRSFSLNQLRNLSL